jgi:septal ring-binding cell division protein DamX
VPLENSNQAVEEAEELVDRVADEVGDDQEISGIAPESIEQEDVNVELAQTDVPAIDADTQSEVQVQIEVQAATASVDELRTTAPATDGLPATEVQVTEIQAIDVPDETANNDTIAESASQAEPASTQTATSAVLPSIQTLSGRLLQDLQASLEWINSHDSSVGTIQIMLLRQNRFDDRVYYDYLDRLSEQGVDISEVRIFATYTGEQKVFSVVYGEYQNRGAANAAKTDLPPILQDTAPIGRSVGGLMKEIQRLEGKN